MFHKLRSARSEKFNGQSKAMSDAQAAVLTKGLAAARHFVVGAIVVYQLTPWHRHEHSLKAA